MVKKFIDAGKGLASLLSRTQQKDPALSSVFQKNLIDTFGEEEVAEGVRIIGSKYRSNNPELQKIFFREGESVEDDLVNLLEARYMGSTRLQAHPLSMNRRGPGAAERYLKINDSGKRLTDLPGGPGDKALYGKNYGEMTDSAVNDYYKKFNEANGFKRAPVLDEMADSVSLKDAGKTIEGTAEPVLDDIVGMSPPVLNLPPEMKPLENMVRRQMKEMDDMLKDMRRMKTDMDARATFATKEADELDTVLDTFRRMVDEGDEKEAFEYLKNNLGKRTKNAAGGRVGFATGGGTEDDRDEIAFEYFGKTYKELNIDELDELRDLMERLRDKTREFNMGGRIGMFKGGITKLLKMINPKLEKEMVEGTTAPFQTGHRADAIGDMQQIKNVARNEDSGLEVFDEMYDMIQKSPRYEGAMRGAFMKLIDYEKFRAMILDDNIKLQRMLKIAPEETEGLIRYLFRKSGSEPSDFSKGGGVGTLFERKRA